MKYVIGIFIFMLSSGVFAIEKKSAIEIAKKEFLEVMAATYGVMSTKIESVEASLATITSDNSIGTNKNLQKISKYSVYYDDPVKNTEYINRLTDKVFWNVNIRTVEGLPMNFRIDNETGEILR